MGRAALVGTRRTPMVWLLVLVLAALVSACGVGKGDAVDQQNGFEFVSPGGQRDLLYPNVADRAAVSGVSGEDLDGEGQVSLDDVKGKVTVVNIWASWCAPCRVEAPELNAAFDQTRDVDAAFLGIDVRDDRNNARAFVKDRGNRYPTIYDQPGRVLLAFADKVPTSVVPATIVLDREHRVAAVYLRTVTVADIVPLVKKLAAEGRA